MTDRFVAPRGTGVAVTTVVALAIVAFSTVLIVRVVDDVRPTWLAVAIPGLLLAVVLVSAMLAVTSYELSGRTLIIRRPLWGTYLDLEGLRSVEHDPAALRWSVRLFGNGGLFTITGWFWSKKLGRYRAFVTDPRRSVILRFVDRTVVISPETPDQFVTCVRDTYPLYGEHA